MAGAGQVDYSAVYQYIADAMVTGANDQQIVEALVAQGWDRVMAVQMVADTRHQMNSLGPGPGATTEAAPSRPASAMEYPRPRSKKHLEDNDYHHESSGGRDMAIGGLICIVGVVVTVASYSAASGGGRYVVAWGAILFGGIQFFKGLLNSAAGK